MVEKILSREELDAYNGFMTVGDLKKFLSDYNIPDTAKVLIERVTDVYYEKHGWAVYLKNGMHSDEKIPETMCQYHPAWSCVYYKEDADILFIDLHY